MGRRGGNLEAGPASKEGCQEALSSKEVAPRLSVNNSPVVYERQAPIRIQTTKASDRLYTTDKAPIRPYTNDKAPVRIQTTSSGPYTNDKAPIRLYTNDKTRVRIQTTTSDPGPQVSKLLTNC